MSAIATSALRAVLSAAFSMLVFTTTPVADEAPLTLYELNQPLIIQHHEIADIDYERNSGTDLASLALTLDAAALSRVTTHTRRSIGKRITIALYGEIVADNTKVRSSVTSNPIHFFSRDHSYLQRIVNRFNASKIKTQRDTLPAFLSFANIAKHRVERRDVRIISTSPTTPVWTIRAPHPKAERGASGWLLAHHDRIIAFPDQIRLLQDGKLEISPRYLGEYTLQDTTP